MWRNGSRASLRNLCLYDVRVRFPPSALVTPDNEEALPPKAIRRWSLGQDERWDRARWLHAARPYHTSVCKLAKQPYSECGDFGGSTPLAGTHADVCKLAKQLS